MNHQIDDYHEAVVRRREQYSEAVVNLYMHDPVWRELREPLEHDPVWRELRESLERDLALLRSWYGVEEDQ